MTPQMPAIHAYAIPSAKQSDKALKEAAIQMETSFLTEMLKAAGLGTTPISLGGGTGEDQFSSFLIREQAEQIARSGGIGLAESIFTALKERTNDT